MKNLVIAFTVFLLCLVVSSDCQITSRLDVDEKTSNLGEIDDAKGQWSLPIIELSISPTHDPYQPLGLEGDQKTDNSRINIVTVPLDDLQSAATGYDKHKGHKEGHHATKGHKGKKGFHADEGHKKKHYEDHGKHHKSGHHDKGGKHYKGHDHHKKHHGNWHKGKKGKKGHHHHIKGHHNKGHKDKGFKNVYHKEEYGHNKKFYDDYDFKKHHKKYDDHDLHYKGHKGDHHKSGQYKGDKHHDKFSKKGNFHKGSKHNDDHGHKKKYGHKKHYDEHHKHSHKKGGDKKYGHKHGSKHGHHDHHGHHSQQHPFYQTAANHDQPTIYAGNGNYHDSHDHEEFHGHFQDTLNPGKHDYTLDNVESVQHYHDPNKHTFIGQPESQPSEIYSIQDGFAETQPSNDGDSEYYDEPNKDVSSSEQHLKKVQETSAEHINEFEPHYVAIDEKKTDYHITTGYPEVYTDSDDDVKSNSSPIKDSKPKGSRNSFMKPFDLMPPFAEPSFQKPKKEQRKPSASTKAPLRRPKQRFSQTYPSPPPPQYTFSQEKAPAYTPQPLETMNRHRYETPHRDVYWKYQIKEYPRYYPKQP